MTDSRRDIEALNPGISGLGSYEYGWSDTDVAGASARRGLSDEVVRDISRLKNEPQWMLEQRLKGLRLFDRKPMPAWGSDLTGIDFDNIKYFVRSTEAQATSWDELPEDIKNTYDRLGIPEAEKQRLVAGVAAQYECLAQDTRVWTATRGQVPIKAIVPGDRVFALDEQSGEFVAAPVRAAAQTGTKLTYEIRVGTRTIRATDNHPFLVLENLENPEHPVDLGDLDETDRSRRHRGGPRRVWKTVAELQVGDLVATPTGLPRVGTARRFPQSGFGPRQSTTDLLWLVGVFLRDGQLDAVERTDRVTITETLTNREVRDEIIRIVHEQFALRVDETEHRHVVVESAHLADWLWANRLAGASPIKQVPEWVLALPHDQRSALLAGWTAVRQDAGPAALGSVRAGSEPGPLAGQIRELAEFCELERPATRDDAMASALDATASWPVTDHLGFDRITSIEEHWVEPVWDVEVDGPHNFVAEGIVVHNSEVVYHQIREDLEEKGVLFLDTDTGLREHEDLFKEYFASVIPAGDNKFASLNTAVWSGGSFVYVPPGVHVDIPLQAYFRINTENMGQFERTLIIADEGSYVHYVEGCLPAGELVTMADGSMRPIETIRVGDRVLSHEGRPVRVSATQIRDHRGDLHRFTPLSSANAFSVTSEHPLLVVPQTDGPAQAGARDGSTLDAGTGHLPTASPRWVPAKDVIAGDFLVYPKPHVTAATPMSLDLARLTGYYLGAGQATVIDDHETLVFSFHLDGIEYVNEVQDLCKRLWDVTSSVRYDDTAHEARVLVPSKAGHHAMTTHVGAGLSGHRVSGDLLGQSDLFLQNLVETYLASHGQGDEGGTDTLVRAQTASREWALQLQSIMARLGTFVTVEMCRPAALGPALGGPVADEVRFEIQWTERPGGSTSVDQVRDGGDYFLVPITSRDDTVVDEPVFNLDVADPDSYLASGLAVHNCTAPIYKSDSLHSAVVEIIVKKDARVRYTTIQNWSNNVYNLVTKRATCAAGATMEWVDGNIGSKVTMKYPAVYLLGRHAKGETLSIAFAGEGQHQDAGAKMVHAAPDTSSTIISKSLARGGGRTSYRGLVQVQEGATGSKSTVRCDALLVDTMSRSDTYPYVDVREDDVQMGHEATVSKVSEDQLFYLMSRGMSEEEAMAMIVRGFVEPIARELPMEYALELNRLIELQMEGAVG